MDKIDNAFPHLISYKSNSLYGEILMDYKGLSLEELMEDKKFMEQINQFAIVSFFF